ncbi:unnamed protein product, partial [Owenia fusiformis]
LTQEKFQKKNILIGVNKDEGLFVYLLPGFTIYNSSAQTIQMYRDNMKRMNWYLSPSTQDSIIAEYLPTNTSVGNANRDAVQAASGDRDFVCPTINIGKAFSGSDMGNTVYMYYLTYRASTEVWPEYFGTIHGADIQWIFGLPLNKSLSYTKEEVALSKDMMDYWSNFAKTG